MELLWIVGGLVVLVVAYFCFGIAVKFFLGWWILALGTPVLLVVAITLGWLGAIAAIAGFMALVVANNRWHDNELYLELEKKVDRIFHFSDT